MQKATRLKRELDRILKNPPPGISCFPRDDNLMSLDANIMGVADTPYESGVFKIEILITDRYPFEPPRLRFLTQVYHPNIDDNGRICLDLLKLPPSGQWRPTVTLEGILIALQMLLTNPNPDDPLMDEIAKEYRLNKQEFEKKAKEWTKKFACQNPNCALQDTSQGANRGEASQGLPTSKRKHSEEKEPADKSPKNFKPNLN